MQNRIPLWKILLFGALASLGLLLVARVQKRDRHSFVDPSQPVTQQFDRPSVSDAINNSIPSSATRDETTDSANSPASAPQGLEEAPPLLTEVPAQLTEMSATQKNCIQTCISEKFKGKTTLCTPLDLSQKCGAGDVACTEKLILAQKACVQKHQGDFDECARRCP